MSPESSNEPAEQIKSNPPPKIAKRLVVGIVALTVLTVAIIAANSGRQLVETSSGCTVTLAGSDVDVVFDGPHASANCSQWIMTFNEQSDEWTKARGYERAKSSSSIVCVLVRGKDTVTISDSGIGIGLVGSLACLSLETDGWEEVVNSGA